jgi:hypothetical protein
VLLCSLAIPVPVNVKQRASGKQFRCRRASPEGEISKVVKDVHPGACGAPLRLYQHDVQLYCSPARGAGHGVTAVGEQDCGVRCSGGTRKPGFPVVGGGECDTESSSVGDVLGTYGVIVPLVDPVTASMP